MRVKLKPSFRQKLETVPSQVQKQAFRQLRLFKKDSSHDTLRNHALRKPYFGSRSIDITGDYRAIYKEFRGEAHFYLLGTHPELYGKDKIST